MRRVHAAAGVAALLIAGGVAEAGRRAAPGPTILMRTVAVGGALGRVALDERSGRAFVLDHQTNIACVPWCGDQATQRHTYAGTRSQRSPAPSTL